MISSEFSRWSIHKFNEAFDEHKGTLRKLLNSTNSSLSNKEDRRGPITVDSDSMVITTHAGCRAQDTTFPGTASKRGIYLMSCYKNGDYISPIEAEAQAILLVLQMASEKKWPRIHVCTDLLLGS